MTKNLDFSKITFFLHLTDPFIDKKQSVKKLRKLFQNT